MASGRHGLAPGIRPAQGVDIVADRLQMAEDRVGERGQGVAGIAVLDVGEGHVEGEDEGAQMAQRIGDVEQRRLRGARQRGLGRRRAIGIDERP